MQAYIGCKIVLAEPMSKENFEYGKGNAFTAALQSVPGGVHTAGYHVVYGNPGGLYHSWSPKEVFETAYRPVTGDEKQLICV